MMKGSVAIILAFFAVVWANHHPYATDNANCGQYMHGFLPCLRKAMCNHLPDPGYSAKFYTSCRKLLAGGTTHPFMHAMVDCMEDVHNSCLLASNNLVMDDTQGTLRKAKSKSKSKSKGPTKGKGYGVVYGGVGLTAQLANPQIFSTLIGSYYIHACVEARFVSWAEVATGYIDYVPPKNKGKNKGKNKNKGKKNKGKGKGKGKK